MTASRHRRLARTGGHPPRRSPVSKCAPARERLCAALAHVDRQTSDGTDYLADLATHPMTLREPKEAR